MNVKKISCCEEENGQIGHLKQIMGPYELIFGIGNSISSKSRMIMLATTDGT